VAAAVLKLYAELIAVFKGIGVAEASTRGFWLVYRRRTFPAGLCNEVNFNMMNQYYGARLLL
jgi:hypothetical protein